MKKTNKILKYFNLIFLALFLVFEAVNYALQSQVYIFYMQKALSAAYSSAENRLMSTAVYIKNIGAGFSDIANIVFFILLAGLFVQIFFLIAMKIKND